MISKLARWGRDSNEENLDPPPFWGYPPTPPTLLATIYSVLLTAHSLQQQVIKNFFSEGMPILAMRAIGREQGSGFNVSICLDCEVKWPYVLKRCRLLGNRTQLSPSTLAHASASSFSFTPLIMFTLILSCY